MQIVGRSSSLFTRVPRIFAHELGVVVGLDVIREMTSTDAETYGGNPALKMPTLRRADGGVVFGAENICRAIVDAAGGARVVWPEDMRDDRGRNAMEMLRHAMNAQVQLVMGTVVGKLPADNVMFAKGRRGFEGAMAWLDAQVDAVVAALPERRLSLFEVELFCMVEHFAVRPTLSMEPYVALRRFAQAWGERPAARETAYRFDSQ